MIVGADQTVLEFHCCSRDRFNLLCTLGSLWLNRSSSQPIEPRRIAKKYFFPFGRRHTCEGMLHGIPRVWISRRDMWEIRFPKNIVDADGVAQRDADRFEPEIDVDLAPKKFARPRRNALGPKSAFFPLAI